MKVVGIIAEYNPFHNGHRLSWNTVAKRKDAGIIMLLSGDFTQRGLVACLPPTVRADFAWGEADLVLQLPLLHSLSSAEGLRARSNSGRYRDLFGNHLRRRAFRRSDLKNC